MDGFLMDKAGASTRLRKGPGLYAKPWLIQLGNRRKWVKKWKVKRPIVKQQCPSPSATIPPLSSYPLPGPFAPPLPFAFPVCEQLRLVLFHTKAS